MEHIMFESKKRVSLIIFDCDGVLIDSELMSCRIQAESLSRLGYKTSLQDIMRRFTGVTTADMYQVIEDEWGRPLPDSFESEVELLIEKAYREDLKIVSGVQETLCALAVPFCVASSSSPQKLRLGLEVVGLYTRFAPNVFSAAQVGRGKPAPDLFLFAADSLNAAPSECVVIEDSVAGVKEAKAAGMQVFGFYGGAHCGPEHAKILREAGADLTLRSMRTLPDVLLKAAYADAKRHAPLPLDGQREGSL
jgi:HAD superfamily hydrolase (TIGR01509 family)